MNFEKISSKDKASNPKDAQRVVAYVNTLHVLRHYFLRPLK